MRCAPRHTSRALRSGALATVTALLLAGCSAADPATPPASSAAAGPPAATSVVTPQPATGVEKAVLAASFDAGTAWVAAHTTSTVSVTDGHTFVVKHTLPTGATADLTYRLSAGGGRTPADGVTVSGRPDGPDRYLVDLRYAVDAATLPADLRAQVSNGIPRAAGAAHTDRTAPDAAPRDAGPRLEQAALVVRDDPSTIDVAVSGVVSQAQESYIDTWADRADSKAVGGSWEAWKAGNKVWDALGASDMVKDALARLDALAACAENPSNPLTRDQYAKDPAAKKKLVDDIAEIKQEVKENAAALFLQLLVDAGSGLVGSAKWLGFIVSPATSYVKQTLGDLIGEQLAAAEARVPRCTHSYAITGSSPSKPSGIQYTGTACSLEKRFTVETTGDYVGSFSFRPNRPAGGTYAYRGKVGNTPSLSVDGAGPYTVTLSGDATTGTLDFEFSSTIRIPAPVGPKSGSHPVHLTLTAIAAC